ncbi:MAG: hypothetical protein ACR2H5_07545 [Ktedonobacteraceae bacterium]
MANEEKFTKRERGEEFNLDEQLADFYGPQLPEQPLSATSWTRVRSQLSTRRFLKRRPIHWLRRRGYRTIGQESVPLFVQHAFTAIVYEARLPRTSYALTMLHCSFKARVRIPKVQTRLIGRHNIKLTLPAQELRSIEAAELDVLLATGLTRLYCMRKRAYALQRFLVLSIEPLALMVLVVLWRRGLPAQAIPIAIMLCALLGLAVVWCLHLLRKGMAISADALMVQWIGRSRACQGLHLLAGRGKEPRSWGEPTLTERIARVCGTQVAVEDERLTLVR